MELSQEMYAAGQEAGSATGADAKGDTTMAGRETPDTMRDPDGNESLETIRIDLRMGPRRKLGGAIAMAILLSGALADLVILAQTAYCVAVHGSQCQSAKDFFLGVNLFSAAGLVLAVALILSIFMIFAVGGLALQLFFRLPGWIKLTPHGVVIN